MKHIIPTLTLTALAAAASAQQAAAPAGLNYNQVGVSRTSSDNTVSVQMALGQSNFVFGVAAGRGQKTDYNYGQIAAGYVFKGVTQGIDATVGIIQPEGGYETVYTLVLRRALNEVYQGLEIAAGYATTGSGSTNADFSFGGVGIDSAKNASFAEVSYNVNKTFQVAVGLTQQPDYNTHTVFSVRAGF
jgi:hypothetical protein